MPNEPGLLFAEGLRDAILLRDGLLEHFQKLDGQEGGEAMQELRAAARGVAFHGAEPGAPPLTLAVVGPYSAGKSSLLRCLTGNADIVVRADPTSHGFETYDWRGLRLLDTPGIEAGVLAHEVLAAAGIREADLLLFVITPNLFDDATAAALQKLAVDDCRAPDLLVVLNKAVSLGGDQRVIEDAISNVLGPLGIGMERLIRTEARSWLDAESERATAAAELRDESGIARLERAIDDLASNLGLTARLTRPLHEIRRIAGETAAALTAMGPEASAASHELRRRTRLLTASEDRVRDLVVRIISRAAAGIVACGDAAAASVVVGATQAVVQSVLDAEASRVQTLVDSAPVEIAREIEQAMRDLAASVEGGGGQALPGADGIGMRRDLSTRTVRPPNAFSASAPANVGGGPPVPGLGRYASGAEKFGKFLADLSMGPRAANGFLSSIQVAGSKAHRIIYDGGKLIGVKFRPWEAVRYAKWVGNTGRVLGIAGAALGVAATLREEHEERKAEQKVLAARADIRSYFRDYALQFERAGRDTLDVFLAGTYGVERARISAAQEDMLSEASARSGKAEPFLAIARLAAVLAEEISSRGPTWSA